MTTGSNRRTVGVALLVSAALMFVAAALSLTGVLPVPMESRMIVGGIIGVAAVADVIIGVRFLGSSE